MILTGFCSTCSVSSMGTTHAAIPINGLTGIGRFLRRMNRVDGTGGLSDVSQTVVAV